MAEQPHSFASRWKQLSGESEWKSLLDPLDIDLRRYLIHYGEMTQATYDCFNSQQRSKHAGNSYYAMQDFFSKVGLEKANPYHYTVTKFFYATSSIDLPQGFLVRSLSREAWDKESNWMGYVAVATDSAKKLLGRRDIVVAWRGTIQSLEWANDFQFILVSASSIFPGHGDPLIHHGWLSLYTSTDPCSKYNKTSAREQILSEVERLVKLYRDEELSISVVGHSLGAAMATLNAADIAANLIEKLDWKDFMVTAFVFASPRVGDSSFIKLCSEQNGLRVIRVRNNLDIVPKCPPGYEDVGEELLMDNTKSEVMKSPGDMKSWHNLEGYLHGIAGTQGMNGGFKMEVPRCVALVNKSVDGLKEECMVPSSWWVLKNNGMRQMEDGSWQLIDYEDDETEIIIYS